MLRLKHQWNTNLSLLLSIHYYQFVIHLVVTSNTHEADRETKPPFYLSFYYLCVIVSNKSPFGKALLTQMTAL